MPRNTVNKAMEESQLDLFRRLMNVIHNLDKIGRVFGRKEVSVKIWSDETGFISGIDRDPIFTFGSIEELIEKSETILAKEAE